MNYGLSIYNKIRFIYLYFLDVSDFSIFLNGNIFAYCWCALYYKLIFLMRLSD